MFSFTKSIVLKGLFRDGWIVNPKPPHSLEPQAPIPDEPNVLPAVCLSQRPQSGLGLRVQGLGLAV